MLIECLPHPDIYDKSLLENEYYCSYLYMMLDMILKNGVILVDNDNKYMEIINNSINQWPKNDTSKKIQRKLVALKNSNRFINIEAKDIEVESSCKKENCNIFYSILNNSNANPIIPECCIDFEGKTKINEFIGTKLYSDLGKVSGFYDKGCEDTFENEVLIPILKYPKVIKIIDRVFASHMQNNGCEINENYKNGLKNIIRIIKENNVNKNIKVELYVAFNSDFSNDIQVAIGKKMIKAIERFINDIKQEYNINLECYYKENYYKLTHERYILTKQIGLEIGRGLDYIDKNGKLRDINISLLSNEQKRMIDSRVRMSDELVL